LELFDDVPDAKSPPSISAVRRPRSCGVEGDPGTGDAAPDHHQVEVSGPQRLQRLGSLEGCLLAHR
jgi:hypothetical protein